MEKKRATTIGFAAIILWSTMVGLIRGVSEGLGAVGGAAMIYSLSGLLLIFTVGFPNLRQIPRRYLLAFVGAFIWAAYCTVTAKYARGKNAITLFVLLTALTLWLKFLASDQPPMLFSWPVVIKLMTVSVALGLAYAAWNVGILHGNVSLLAAASYFTPVLSSALAAILLSATLSWSFWQGAGMVCLGSLLCWYATRR
ncbi:aromatic amino acid DMT transporter YddG [Klebsiella pneumoniae]|uniref:aromatic amino acid DMT transporter YddG n=1 Tax=Klebsiella pneumoniae TaxID=573 RepID=UPI0039F1415D